MVNDKFKEYVSKVMIPGQRNRFLSGCANKAKYYEISEDEALSVIRNYWGSDFTPTDENSFRKAYREVRVTSTYSEDVKNKRSLSDLIRQEQKDELEISKIQKEVEKEAAFFKRLNDVEKEVNIENWLRKNRKKYSKTSDFMLNIFDENDFVWASNDPRVVNAEKEIKDMFVWSKAKESLNKYNYYSINPFKNNLERKKSNISKFKYTLFECDDLSKKEQYLFFIDLINAGVPIKMITSSGNKSLHALVKIPSYIDTLEKYEEYTTDLFNMLSEVKNGLVDEACKNPDRLSRIPFGIRNIDFEEKEQYLIYLQEDDCTLQNDVRERLQVWTSNIIGKKLDTIREDVKDEIDEDEILSLFKNREHIIDIWNDGGHFHTLMKIPTLVDNKRFKYYNYDKKWESATSFYSFIQQKIKEIYNFEVEVSELKKYKVKFKVEQKVPYVGKKYPVKKDFVNTFVPGWLYDAINDDRIPNELNRPLKLMLHNIFGDDKEVMKWTLQWMREFMHSFDVITAPVFWSTPGTGKSMLTEAFGEAIGDSIKTPPKKDDIQFNAWLENTVIIFEESSSGSKFDGKELGDKLKDWITAKMVTIEKKGKDPIKKIVHHCFLFNANISNRIPPVFIEEEDRRYTIVKNVNAQILNNIWSDEDFRRWDSGEYKKILMKWIYNLPKDESVNIRRGIDNTIKQEIVEMNKTNLEYALEDLVQLNDGFISCEDLLAQVKRQGVNSATSRSIGIIMKKMGFESKLIKQFGKVVRGYELHCSLENN